MTRNVIYFPYMQAPEGPWFNQMLLYWDDVYSIIPSECQSNTFLLSDYMVELIQNGLVKAFTPDQYLNESYLSEKKIYNFYNLFLEYVKSDQYPVPKDPRIRSQLPTSSIHMDKLEYFDKEVNILRDLDKLGLVSGTNFPWIEVEEYTAKLYIAYLAAFAGELPEIQAKPVTNDPDDLKPYNKTIYKNGQIETEKDKMRCMILDNILPTPINNIKPEELIKFKNNHLDSLIEFRRSIENEIHSLLKIEDLSYRNRVMKNFIVESKDNIDEISASMKRQGWKLSKELYLSIILAILDFATAIPASLDYHQINPLLLAKAALNNARTTYEVYKYQNRGIKDNNFAYAIHCQRELL